MKKRILVIDESMRKEAAGALVDYNILLHLSEIYDLELVCRKLPEFDDLNSRITTNHFFDLPEFPKKLKVFLLKFFTIDLDLFFYRRAARSFLRRNIMNSKFDLVFSFIAANSYRHVSFGNTVAQKLGIKHFVYSVDPVPAVIGWAKARITQTRFRFRNLVTQLWNTSPIFDYRDSIRFVRREFKNIDFYFASNRKMLEYQLGLFDPKKGFNSAVLFTPILMKYPSLGKIEGSDNFFIYAGRFYGARKPDSVFKAFQKLLKVYPNSYLEIIGQDSSRFQAFKIPDEVFSRIKFYGFMKDLKPFYKKATALIDVDADVENDVYLSSKIINYLPVERPIISQTGMDSPAREVFADIESIIQCGHSDEEIFQAMLFTVKNKNNISIDDRRSLIEKFSIDAQINLLKENISKYA
jgi:glycosyltransferase involved in cell wall biosynthesis